MVFFRNVQSAIYRLVYLRQRGLSDQEQLAGRLALPSFADECTCGITHLSCVYGVFRWSTSVAITGDMPLDSRCKRGPAIVARFSQAGAA